MEGEVITEEVLYKLVLAQQTIDCIARDFISVQPYSRDYRETWIKQKDTHYNERKVLSVFPNNG